MKLAKEHKKEEKQQESEIKHEELEKKVQELEQEVLRAKADLINYRKRKDEEVSNILKYANQDILSALLPVLDNFERAIANKNDALSEEMEKFLSGFNMIYTSLKEIITASGVKEIECLGEKFDSKCQNCLFTDSDPSKDDEVVLDVLMKGYTYNDKILRCASVKVNKIDKQINEEENNNLEKEDDKNE